jgi:hypothetical protein
MSQTNRLDEVSGPPRIDPGATAVALAVAVLLVLLGHALPWIGPASGWNVLFGRAGAVGVLPSVFSVTSLLFGVVGCATGLVTRLWVVGWASAFGCGFSVVTGVWAVWSRQTAGSGAPGPGPGLLLVLVAMVLMAAMWVRLAWSRPGGRANG